MSSTEILSLAVFTIGIISIFCVEIFTSFGETFGAEGCGFSFTLFRILLADSIMSFTFTFSVLESLITAETESIVFLISSFC